MQGGGDGNGGGRGGGQPPGGQQFDPASCKSLYVGNLHAYVTETMLQEVFAQIGPLVEVKIIKDKVTGMSAGYGFVKFYEHPVAEAALTAVNGKLLYGQV
jgi:nucleolysin TIA-1/TIAR